MCRAAGCFLAILVFAAALSKPDSEELAATGRSLYVSLCQRCHGENGDLDGYPGIVPLSGITLRLPRDEIATLSAPFVGRAFQGKEAEALNTYLDRLKGQKGFERPGHLLSPNLLEKKLGETSQYRIIDVRPADDYKAGHVPNAVAWPNPKDGGTTSPERLAQLGAGPETFVVVYDNHGGPQAAAVWFSLYRAGYQRIAILDGGFKRWTDLGFPLSARPESFPPLALPQRRNVVNSVPEKCGELPEKRLVLGPGEGTETEDSHFDWRKTRNDNGLLSAADIRAYLDTVGFASSARYTPAGNLDDLAYLVFLLHLLGFEAWVSPAGDALCVAEYHSR
jgi:rhodanese-related sulfurtransferase